MLSEKQILTLEGCTGCAFDEYRRKIKKDGTPFGVFDSNNKKISGAYWASHNRLSASQIKCMTDNNTKITLKNPKTGKLISQYKWLTACPNANNEWLPRYKFFERIQRFPLCGTSNSEEEKSKLTTYKETHK